jgi:hypothetical protein
MKDDEHESDGPPPLDGLAFGTSLAVGVIAPCLIGHYIDQRRETEYCVLIGFAVGALYCGYEIWKLIRRSKGI